MPGNDFSNAEVISGLHYSLETIPVDERHYFTFTITNSDNSIQLSIIENDNNTANNHVERFIIYDNSLTEIYAFEDERFLFNLPIGQYYIEVYDELNLNMSYLFTFFLNDAGNYPLPHNNIKTTFSFQDLNIINNQAILPNEHKTDILQLDTFNTYKPPHYINDMNQLFIKENLELINSNFNSFNKKSLIINNVNNNRVIANSAESQYVIKGRIKKDGLSFSNSIVRLYDRNSGQLIEETKSNDLGQYSFLSKVDKDYKYFVIAHDDFENPVLQAVIHDYLDPIKE